MQPNLTLGDLYLVTRPYCRAFKSISTDARQKTLHPKVPR